MLKVGLCYKYGEGVQQSNRWAIHNFNKAIEFGHARAEANYDTDGWGTWMRYQVGFGALTLAFSEFGFLMLVNKINYLQLHTTGAAMGVLGIVFISVT